ncbi:phosphatidylinositol 3-5-bisphosphate-binding protein [Penicillium chermesinum]|nr:phosphatidylinositol 3-5-bisphosphate-binding protein [Penicillium chermesinum]
MNTRPVIDESVGPYSLSTAFNNDTSCFSVGLDTGFCEVRNDTSTEAIGFLSLTYATVFNAGIGIAEMLGQSNYLAIVGGGRNPKFPQNKLIIWDDAKQKIAITLEFRTSVLGVRLSKTRIVVALLNSIHVFAFSTPPHKLSVYETSDNPLGLACLGQKLLAFPGRSLGSSPLRAMALSPDGEVLATGSESGTLVRLFSTANCRKMAELRRGVDPAVIFSLSFSPSNSLLAVTSDKSTLHIFDVPHPREMTRRSQSPAAATEEGTNQKWGFLSRVPLLPRLFSDEYSFANANFDIGDGTVPGSPSLAPHSVPTGRPQKGITGWLDDRTILVIGAGRDGRWEKFVLYDGEDGKRYCVRDGWKRYLGGSTF